MTCGKKERIWLTEIPATAKNDDNSEFSSFFITMEKMPGIVNGEITPF